ncbi:MAG: endolytic transglycosylase MltG [Rikenellaceae bacterium]|nr:endolytic transglycosylase MltG [Rikenellaceae bacterium]
MVIFDPAKRIPMNLLKNKKIKYLLFSLIAVTVIIGVACFVTFKNYTSVAVHEAGVLFFPTGSTFDQQLDTLRANGNIENFDRLVKYLNLRKVNNIKPGRYALPKGMTYNELGIKLRTGNQDAVNVTFNNIRTREKLAGVVSKYIEADSLSLINALHNKDIAYSYGFDEANFMSMFIPDTYKLYWNTDAEGFIDRMFKEYTRFWNDSRMEKLKNSGLTREQVSILASIVAEETVMKDEMPRVAGVYLNRLRIGMLLQADPTVKYAVGDFTLRRILNKHLETDSPYNTYMYSGLPPGPICVPPVAAIDAVLEPEEHNYLYFCAKDDFSGYHNFAVNHAQHIRNRNAYINALNQRGI